jgi:hypothetical protein
MSSGNRVQELLDELHAMITEAWGIPLGAEKCVIERNKALDLLDDIRAQFPQELAEAKRLVEARSEFIGNAKREAEAVRKAAEDRARQLVDEQEILRVAQTRSTEMLNSAERSSAELRRAANEYIDDALRHTEEVLASALTEMRESRAKFRDASQ